jgi:hypothetical protein
MKCRIVVLLPALMTAAVNAGDPDFVRDVRPILDRSCIACHGPARQKSGYRIDLRDIAMKGGDSGEAAIVPHDAQKSPLIHYVTGDDQDRQMPPPSSGKPKLTRAEVDTLRAWINAGPVWPEELSGALRDQKTHWSLQPLAKAPVLAGSAHPIDALIRARLSTQELTPAPLADRRTLIRRLSYDLIGLPPTPDQVDAFVADRSPTALDALVTRLLESPRYGEHWARHWLDVAHYADTHGNDHDYARPNAWPYRDYVIDAFNDDKPYARFVQEQIAGDALFGDDPQATTALGFLAAGPWDETLMVGVREETVDHRFSQVLNRDDMVTTVMSTFAGLTVHCARCHNHKFDPISQREYYALQAVFAGVDRADRPYDLTAAAHIKRRELTARREAISRRQASVMASLGSSETARMVARFTSAHVNRHDSWKPLEVVSVASAAGCATSFARQADGSWFVSGERPEKDTFLVTAQTKATDIRAIRLEALADNRLPGGGPGRYGPSGNFHLTEFRAFAQPASGPTSGATRLEFSVATADHDEPGFPVSNAIDGQPNTFWGVHPRYGVPHEAVFELKEPLGSGAGTTLIIRLEQNGTGGHQLGRFRLSYCTGALAADLRAPAPATLADLLQQPENRRTPEERRALALRVLEIEVDRAIAALPAPRFVYAVTRDFPASGSFKPARTPRPIHVLVRGDLNKPGEPVEPGALACVNGLAPGLTIADPNVESNRRAALALWLSDDRNALSWRVIVNRVWHYHFGRGLCDTPNDFGKMGGTPSHPELLDWLAAWFRDEAKGSLKALHRLIVSSQTYQQSALERDQGGAHDPDNRLLSRMNRTRLTAEQVRDTLLQASGRLDLTMGGPPVVQFVDRGPATFNPAGGAPAFLDYDSFSPDAPENRRRAIYRFLFRTVPDPFMDALDAPDGGSLTPVRGQATTVFGAFALLNNAFVIRQCEHIAARLAKEAQQRDQVALAFRLLLSRDARPEELDRLVAYVQKHGLANACQILVNSNEFLYID